MSRTTSFNAAGRILNANPEAEVFSLRCNCGWAVDENRPHVMNRIESHFAWPDANSSEHVEVVPES